MKNAFSAYAKTSLDNKVLGETPHGLIRLLLEKLCEKLTLAIETLEQSHSDPSLDSAKKIAESLRVSSEIVSALKESLVDADHTELFEQLNNLYIFLQYQIVKTITDQKAKPAKDALEIAKELLSIWETIPAEYHEVCSK